MMLMMMMIVIIMRVSLFLITFLSFICQSLLFLRLSIYPLLSLRLSLHFVIPALFLPFPYSPPYFLIPKPSPFSLTLPCVTSPSCFNPPLSIFPFPPCAVTPLFHEPFTLSFLQFHRRCCEGCGRGVQDYTSPSPLF